MNRSSSPRKTWLRTQERQVFLVVALGAGLALGGCRRTAEPSFRPDDGPRPAATPTKAVEPVGAPPRLAPTPATKADEPTEAATADGANPALLDPSLATERAPDTYAVELITTEGPVIIDVTRSWAPKGADRFYNLVRVGFFEDIAFFRVIEGFMAQGGISGDPAITRAWRTARIQDDPPTQSNTRGMVTFATSGPNSRTTQFFVNFVDNSRLDPMGFAPFGKVRDMTNVDRLHAGYGEGAPRGQGPEQSKINARGNEYLRSEFPELDYIRSARIVPAP